ncbi:protein kinase C and casein kinase substrate in neurons protein 2 isoform X1 [Brienomyrus brachyistius]|uniref:protein kinase C and casein kinase substrate in neurons protein 2 isoform X1 n=1 Tax=Brienomyrus brachyistius TaxID=42636 RepID=UPI0020B2DA34|nr:protein kinase C and casein kinase substrate in neurons protein 2 isoform X1 [Brienomyrus brachyistius]XP_048881742.1 protein kinase C and casein kinase substrate in neurons protein 2 isoform X1 [Brienomyrus brachyistius]XP_048881750.1 protein kinase C and casein kinase substrate in neurons protein 2 isoform X1 [Brienomyrus brachyistius]XP_048881759.1 protein kinase C and casein kinase substrate in neurons protein 2 isoform X1 [Brienomyrus brachyistius]XP_048881767.1 protein kinase C and cas
MSGSYDDSMIDVSSDSFWEVGNYKRTVKRVDDGQRLCNDLMNCVHERARIEKAYAMQLTEWAKRWRQLIEKGPQYGTLERAWTALMTEAEKVSDLHMEVKTSLMSEDFEKIKNWQKEAYHKQMIGGFKETKEAEDGFRKAQKPWAKKLKEVDIMKKTYHSACKEEKLATSRENNSKLESNNPDAQKKLQDKVEKCQQEVQKMKERYEKSLEELDKSTPQYMENMEQVFEQWQQFEDKRIRFFREVLLEVKSHLDLSANPKFQTVYHTLEDTIKSADVEEDLKWFRSNHGPGMPMNWPQFENLGQSVSSSRVRRSILEWSIDLNRTLSRRDKKRPSDGVTLTGINQASEPAAKTNDGLTLHSNPEQGGSNPFEEEDADQEATPALPFANEEVKTKIVAKTQDWSDDDDTGNPFAGKTNGSGNPFDDEPSSPAVSVPVRALYDYEGQEQDELTFKAGDEFTKIGNEDDQGWCKGLLKDGHVGLYPANYVENI